MNDFKRMKALPAYCMECPCSNIVYFFSTALSDARISPNHIALYLALWNIWRERDFDTPLNFHRQAIMEQAHIYSKGTYFRLILELHQFGYIRYFPAGHRYVSTCVDLSRAPGGDDGENY